LAPANHFAAIAHVRYTHEILFAFNCALPAALVLCVMTNFQLFIQLKYRFNAAFHSSAYSGFGADCAFLLLATTAAISIFILLRMFAKNSVAEAILGLVAGIASFVAVPICWLLLVHQEEPNPFEAKAIPWSWAEVGICVALALAWFFGKWVSGFRVFFLLVTFHLLFWSWLYLRNFYNPSISILLLVVGACSSLAWARFVSMSGAAREPGGIADVG